MCCPLQVEVRHGVAFDPPSIVRQPAGLMAQEGGTAELLVEARVGVVAGTEALKRSLPAPGAGELPAACLQPAACLHWRGTTRRGEA